MKQETLPETIVREEIIEAPKTNFVLAKGFVPNLSGATPSVKNMVTAKLINSAPTNVTDLLDAQNGQIIKILGDGQSTFVHNTSVLCTNTGANKLLAVNIIYTFTSIGGVWYEDE